MEALKFGLGILVFISLCVFYIWFLLNTNRTYEGKKFSFLVSLLYGVIGFLVGISWQLIIGIFLRFPTNIAILLFVAIIGFVLGFASKMPNKSLVKVKRLFAYLLILVPIATPFICPSLYEPKLIDVAREKTTEKNLKNIREAVFTYYKENGSYPIELERIVKDAIGFPKVILQRKIGHLDSNKILIISTTPNQPIQPSQITDEGGWIYSPDSGDIRINCSHKDTKGVFYYEW